MTADQTGTAKLEDVEEALRDVVDPLAGVQPHPQRHLVAAGRVHVVDLGVVRLAQPLVVGVAVVVQDDLLVHLLELH